MMNYNNMQPALPFQLPDGLSRPLRQALINPQNPQPPYVPATAYPMNHVNQYLPELSAWLALDIEQRAGQNPMRMFAYNLLGLNNYNNPYFSDLLAKTADQFAFHHAQQRGGVDPQQIAVSTNQMYLGVIYMQFQNVLANLVDPSVAQNAVGLFHNFQNAEAVFTQWWNSVTNTQGQMGGMMRNSMAPGMAIQQRVSSGVGGSLQPQQQQQRQMGGSYANRPTLGGNHNAPAAAAPIDALRQPYSARNRNQVQEQPQPEVQAEDTGPYLLPQIGCKKKWTPSADEPQLTAWNQHFHSAWFQIEGDTVRQFISEKDVNMDQDKHVIPTFFQSTSKPSERATAVTNLTNTLRHMAPVDETTAAELDASMPIVDMSDKDSILATCTQAAWIETMMRRASETPTIDVMAYEVLLAEPMVLAGVADQTPLINALGESVDYRALADRLEAVKSEMHPELWAAINRRMTDHINRIFRLQMSTTAVRITSFADDCTDALAAIQRRCGEGVYKSVLAAQRKEIRRLFGKLDDDIREAQNEQLMASGDFSDDNKPNINYLVKKQMLVFLTARMADLGVCFDPHVGAALVRTQTPLVTYMAEKLFQQPYADEVYNVLVRSADGIIFELSRSYLDEGSYLISLVSE